ncbi:MAG: hypothetical protein ACD_75C00316G0002 [uncultured bacterium]|nr:MAG: hypothetical protein ACD_75C00316G0002 [uncultured bacterium]
MAHFYDGDHDSEQIDLDHRPFLNMFIEAEDAGQEGRIPLPVQLQADEKAAGEKDQRKDDGREQHHHGDEIVIISVKV